MHSFNRLWQTLLDCFLPQVCCLCQVQTEFGICEHCIGQLPIIPEEIYLGDGLKVATLTPYLGNTLAIIQALKYHKIRRVGERLGTWISSHIAPDILNEVDIIIPVPLHSKRFREREFNQSELLFRACANNFKIPIVPAVNRVKNTQALHELNARQRQRELSNSFIIDDDFKPKIQGKRVMIVDDICTSGATFLEIATILRPSVAEIRCFAFSHTPKTT